MSRHCTSLVQIFKGSLQLTKLQHVERQDYISIRNILPMLSSLSRGLHDQVSEKTMKIQNNNSNEKQIYSTVKQISAKLRVLGEVGQNDLHILFKKMEKNDQAAIDKELINLTLDFILKAAEQDYLYPSLVEKTGNLIFSSKNFSVFTKDELLKCMQILEEVPSIEYYQKLMGIIRSVMDSVNIEDMEIMAATNAYYGDYEAIESLISLCQTQNVEVTEKIHAALLKAYAMHKDELKVSELRQTLLQLPVLSNFGLDALLCASIHLGKLNQFKEDAKSLSNAMNLLTVSQFNSLLVKAANQDLGFIDFIFDNHKLFCYSLKCRRALSEILWLKKYEVLGRLVQNEKLRMLFNQESDYCKLVMELMRSDRDYLVKLCKELDSPDDHHFHFTMALKCAIDNQKWDIAWDLLKAMHECNCPMKPSYIWPFICATTDHGEIFECIEKAQNLGIEIDNEGLVNVICPRLVKDSEEELELVLRRLNHLGLPKSKVLNPLLVNIVIIKAWKGFNYLVNKYSGFDTTNIVKSLAVMYDNDPNSVVSLSQIIQKCPPEMKSADFGGFYLETILRSRSSLDADGVIILLKKMKQLGIRLSDKTSENLQLNTMLEKSDQLKNIIDSIKDSSLTRIKNINYKLNVNHDEWSVLELESHLIELKSKNMNTRGVLRKLILAHSKSKNEDKLNAVLQEIKDGNHKQSPGMLAVFMRSQADSGQVDEAFAIYQVIVNSYPEFIIDAYKILFLAIEFVKANRIDDADHLLSDYMGRTPPTTHHQNEVSKNVVMFLSFCAKKSYELTRRMLDKLVTGGMAEISIHTTSLLVTAKLNSGDLDGAIDEFIRIFDRHHIVSARGTLLLALYEKLNHTEDRNERENLLKKIDIVSKYIVKHRGLSQMKVDKLFASLRAQNISEAELILSTVNFEQSYNQLKAYIEWCSSRKDDEPLDLLFRLLVRYEESIQKITGQCLLNVYYVRNLPEKAKKLKEIVENNNIMMDESFYVKLDRLLSRNS